MFECVEKKSSEKSDTFNYEYKIKTSQEIIEESDKSEAICSEENRANEFPTFAIIGGGVALVALIFALISCI